MKDPTNSKIKDRISLSLLFIKDKTIKSWFKFLEGVIDFYNILEFIYNHVEAIINSIQVFNE